MTVKQALEKRKSVRAFLDKDVPTELIKELLNQAKLAPSGVNMQPWQICVVSGAKKRELETTLCQKFDDGIFDEMEYEYYPKVWQEPYKSRRKETGLLMYETLGITREDKERQHEQWKANYRAFDAPVVLLFFIDKHLEAGSYLDYGMFLQSFMLAATASGLATCPQAAYASYAKSIKEALHVKDDSILLGGIALGYEDEQALVNSYRTTRLKIEDFVRFYE
ncbi:MAG TPA: nitroreductase [Sulfurospirillum sp. UBA12182]|jgi:nitroreductase|nr:MAG TPA: nitroreductase [Sulfurospirillum sp. UBA12182]